jgi:hypothetical protein
LTARIVLLERTHEEANMEQDERIEQLKEEARRLSRGQMHSFGIDDLPKDTAEQFLERVIAFETAPTTTHFDRLTADRVPLPPPNEVTDREIGVMLWRVIFALAKHRVFLSCTNHLSDRELYSVLWHTVLREEVTIMTEGDAGAWHVGVPGDDPESTNYFTYYASENDRESWQKDLPELALPPRKLPMHDRDDDLPRAEDDPPCAEAREWLQTSRNPSALATNRFGTTADALTFVEQLYAEGASCVIVDHITTLPHDNGEPYADELIVVFPDDARRNAIFGLVEHEGRPDTVDDEQEVIDQGRGSVRLWWD